MGVCMKLDINCRAVKGCLRPWRTAGLSASVAAVLALSLAGCGGQSQDAALLSGQVSMTQTQPKALSHYAASRFLEQSSMGPSPRSVELVRQVGVAGWIDQQIRLPASKIITPASLINYDLNKDRDAADRMRQHFDTSMYNLFVGGEDQLRIKTSWVLSNFLVVSTRKIQEYGGLEYFNTLQTHALGQYADLLKAVTRSPAMGFYLDNGQNRRQQLNENYGRELMQLFSVGLVQLNIDGTPKRDAKGKPLETYTQQDVIEATRALTGWNYADPDEKRASSNGFNYGKPMVVNWPDDHDVGAKKVLGRAIPAGQDAYKDLDSLINILVEHPNTAPFVSLRLIQGMTTSDPSPAYLSRVATVFAQTKGNLAKVVTAILTDPEARAGDALGASSPQFGRIKEPLLVHVNVLRGLGCRAAVRDPWDNRRVWQNHIQKPLQAYSVFNFFPPNHRTQGTNVLAPEQKLLNANEFSNRLGMYSNAMDNEAVFTEAGCDVQAFKSAGMVSDEALVNLLSERFFRGTLSASVARSMIEANKNYWRKDNKLALTGAMLEMATITPAFGVIK